jgi:2-methylisoborneol synthase
VTSRLGLAGGPTGLGTAALRIGSPGAVLAPLRATPARAAPTGGVAAPRLYGPGAVRDDEALARAVDDRLVAWIQEEGIFAGEANRLRHQSYGRLVMLTHPDTNDPDQLMLAARWAVALWAADDLYTDDQSAGADATLVAPRLLGALAAIDTPALLGRYAGQLRDALAGDDVLIALRSSMEWLARHATPSQLHRTRHEIANMFVSWNAAASWRTAGRVPPVWEYLMARHFDSFVPCMVMIDIVGGYELPAVLYADPRVNRAVMLAGSAATIANDLYSMAKEERPELGDVNLPVLVAAEERCSLQEAVDISVSYHAEVVRAFEAAHRELLVVPSPELQRFLLGLRAWIGGSDEWHRTSGRYRS